MRFITIQHHISAHTSSMNSIAGAAARASSKAATSRASASPRLVEISSAAPKVATWTPRLPAMARAMSVLPKKDRVKGSSVWAAAESDVQRVGCSGE